MGILKILLIFLVSFTLGQRKGYIDGVESIEFDRIHANLKLQQCLRIVRSE
jgi:hypothetical protein